VRGGTRPPCQPDHWLKWFEENAGRPCPRVLLHPENADAWELLNLGLGEDAHGFSAAYGAGLARFYDRDGYRNLFARVSSVRGDSKFVALLEDEIEKVRTRPKDAKEPDE